MRAEGIDALLKMEDFSVMGFSDVIFALPRLLWYRNKICRWVMKHNPSAVILIDYIEFNMNLAKTLRRQGYQGKIIQYVSPTVWAWRPQRADTLAAYCDLLLTIFPFEEKFFAHTSLPVIYVGNPIKERIQTLTLRKEWKKELQLDSLDSDAPFIALFPGSRSGEIDLNLPKQLAVAEQLIRRQPHLRFALSCATERMRKKIMKHVRKSTLTLGQDLFIIPGNYSQELMEFSTAAIAKSGTVTLELALHRCPAIAMYEMSFLNRFIAKHLIKLNLRYYCIVNILAETELFPEFYERHLPVDTMAEALEILIFDEDARARCIRGCTHINTLLGEHDAADNAAKAILGCVRK